MNAPETIRAAEPINPAHEVLVKALDAMCAQQIAAEIHSRPRPTKPQMKAVDKWLKELHACGMLTSQPGRGGVALYSLITPVCDLVQTEGKSQTAAFAERILTPEAEAEREDFEAMYGMLGNCSCHISPPCGSCVHPGNPRNQEEDETAWMAAGDSEGGETDAPAVDAQREEFTLLGLIADIRAAAGDPDGRLMQDELVQHIAGVVKERDDLRERLEAIAEQLRAGTIPELENATGAEDLAPHVKTLCDALADAESVVTARGHTIDGLRLEVADLRDSLDTQIKQWQVFAGRLNTELAIERRSREELQKQGNATDVTAAAVGYLVRVPKRPPMIRRKPEAARLAALGAVRAGASRAEVLAVVSVGVARRGAEWRDA